MKVLVIHNRYRSLSPSGENRVVDQETSALELNGHTVEHYERHSDDIDTMSLPQKALVPAQVLWSQSAEREVSKILGSYKPDIVHVHNIFPMISPSVLLACRKHLVPVVVTLHNYRLICPSGDLFRDGAVCHDCIGRVPIPAVRHGCYRGSAIETVPIAISSMAHKNIWKTVPSAYIFISGAQLELFSSLDLPKSRCFVKPNLVYPMIAEGEKEPLVVYLGRLDEVKGLRLLMEAWDHFVRSGRKDLKLVIAGGGPLDLEIKEWAKRHNSVEVPGFLNRDQCSSLLARARASVVPSQWEEPFGLVVPEAMSASVPSIAPSRGSFPELISDGVDGVLFPPDDAIALAGLLGDVEQEPERFVALGQKAKLTYEQRFAPQCSVAQLETIYRFAIDHPIWIELDGTKELRNSPIESMLNSPGVA